MKTKPIIFLIALLVIFSYSCNKNSDESGYEEGIFDALEELESEMNYLPSSQDFSKDEKTRSYSPDDTETIVTLNKPEETDETVNIEKKIIKTANISFGVSDYKTSKSNIDTIISVHKAYIASENEYNSEYSISNTIVIRVPAENFEKLLASLEGEAEQFESKSINTSDVTEEYVDIIKRLENKKKVEAQYNELLKKARTIAEILEVNEHIRVLREEIEAKEGRLKYLKNQVGLSTITLYMHEDYGTVSYGFFHKVTDALGGGWEGFLGFIIGLLYIWPLILIGVGIWLLIRRGIRKRRKRKAEKTT